MTDRRQISARLLAGVALTLLAWAARPSAAQGERERPRRSFADESHRIRLEVNRPGLKVRTRSGYVDLSRKTEISYVTESALLLGMLPDTILAAGGSAVPGGSTE